MKEQALARYQQLLTELGRGTLNALYPNDFEAYLISLELVATNSNGIEETVAFFSFPVMPSNISQTEPQITNIKRNFGGITVVNSNRFITKQISIQGNFGRNFRVLIGNNVIDFTSISSGVKLRDFKATSKKLLDSKIAPNVSQFSNYVKTGYGSIKLLQAICDKSVDNDNGNPRKLFLHNPSFGESYLVKVINASFTQSQASNMIWNYNLQLQAIAPTNTIRGREDKSLSKYTGISTVQNAVNLVATSVVRTFLPELTARL